MALTLILVSRSYCHLCHEMELAIGPLAKEFGVMVKVVDVDSDSRLVALYNEKVPVLLYQQVELCQHRLDSAKVRDYLSKIS